MVSQRQRRENQRAALDLSLFTHLSSIGVNLVLILNEIYLDGYLLHFFVSECWYIFRNQKHFIFKREIKIREMLKIK